MSTMGNPVSDTDENGLRLGQETEELHHDRVSLSLGKVMHQARQADEWTQKIWLQGSTRSRRLSRNTRMKQITMAHRSRIGYEGPQKIWRSTAPFIMWDTYVPVRLINVVGDGNCGFRALSMFMFGHEEAHPILRTEICQYIAAQSLGWMLGMNSAYESAQSYLTRKRMAMPNSWMGTVELQAAAEINMDHYDDSIWNSSNIWPAAEALLKDVKRLEGEKAELLQQLNAAKDDLQKAHFVLLDYCCASVFDARDLFNKEIVREQLVEAIGTEAGNRRLQLDPNEIENFITCRVNEKRLWQYQGKVGLCGDVYLVMDIQSAIIGIVVDIDKKHGTFTRWVPSKEHLMRAKSAVRGGSDLKMTLSRL
ncbi:hypothetical protein QR680_006667 [Steinernema hermaphroditum]|uniref:OTU domain-containing protein n=1 Tax=Steinernema hermaphroditum TaxID=289476 RepID=A0AA39HW49_9BILA|nr:hypothetical protein QR680_006667 [Steinernema hermaphroditum]